MNIDLGRGRIAIVDDSDAVLVSHYKWRLNGRYVFTKTERRTLYLHRYLLSAPKGVEVDHINQDPLDNRRHNLRLCNRSQNNANVKREFTSRSGFRGVFVHTQGAVTPKFRAEVKYQNKVYRSARFTDAESAARQYDIMARKIHGEFAILNFPDASERAA